MTAPELRAARKALGLSQQGLAEAIGMSRISVARMEAGAQEIEQRTAMAVNLLLREYSEPQR